MPSKPRLEVVLESSTVAQIGANPPNLVSADLLYAARCSRTGEPSEELHQETISPSERM
jgi:hypothetical protein